MRTTNFRQILNFCKTEHIDTLTDIGSGTEFNLDQLERWIPDMNDKARYLHLEFLITDQCLVGVINVKGKFKPLFYYGKFAD